MPLSWLRQLANIAVEDELLERDCIQSGKWIDYDHRNIVRKIKPRASIIIERQSFLAIWLHEIWLLFQCSNH